MSDQRKMRTELKQGLHQFTMSLYHSYRQSLSHEDALKEITHCLEEEYQYFAKQPLTTPKEPLLPAFDLTSYIQTLEKKAKKETTPEKQYEYYDDLEVFMTAQSLLSKYAPTGVTPQ